jgi:hypothetical protein
VVKVVFLDEFYCPAVWIKIDGVVDFGFIVVVIVIVVGGHGSAFLFSGWCQDLFSGSGEG